MNAGLARDELLPRPPDARGRGLVMAVLIHLVLVGALTLGVSWKSSEPDAVEAELWASVPQAAAPAQAAEPEPPPPPKPQPRPEPVKPPPPVQQQVPDREAEIALEKQRKEREARKLEQEQREREKLARERREAERKEAERKQAELKRKQDEAERLKREQAEKLAQQKKAEAERKAREEKARVAAEQQKRIEALREERLARLTSQAGNGSQATGVAQSTNTGAGSPSAGWVGRLRAKVRPNIVFTDAYTGNPAAEVEVRAAPDGTILGTRLVKSSGHAEWDQAVLRALDKTQTLPRDDNGRVPASFVITFRPRDL
jgi:colicin import membrane protein